MGIHCSHVVRNFGAGLSRIHFSEQVGKRQYPGKWNFSVTGYGTIRNNPVGGTKCNYTMTSEMRLWTRY